MLRIAFLNCGWLGREGGKVIRARKEKEMEEVK
jgi:hypothetical protein